MGYRELADTEHLAVSTLHWQRTEKATTPLQCIVSVQEIHKTLSIHRPLALRACLVAFNSQSMTKARIRSTAGERVSIGEKEAETETQGFAQGTPGDTVVETRGYAAAQRETFRRQSHAPPCLTQ